MSIHVFAGPTISAERVQNLVNGAKVHPPIAHGDLLRVQLVAGDVVVIVDGYFHQRASVRHKEILARIAAGVTVIGCSSMGALRAAELHVLGMIGNGAVFEMYRDGVIESDDEVAVAHGESPDFRRLSEPLVNVRIVLAQAQRHGALSTGEAVLLLDVMKRLPYSKRSWRGLLYELEAVKFDTDDAVRRLEHFLGDNPDLADTKEADAVDTLSNLEKITDRTSKSVSTLADSVHWRSRRLYAWQQEFVGDQVDGVHFSYGKVLQFQQIYNDQFSAVWRNIVLQSIAASGSASEREYGCSVDEQVLCIAARQGISAETLTTPQVQEWLTTDECVSHISDEAVLKVMVRSYRPTFSVLDTFRSLDRQDLVADLGARRAVLESLAVNEHVSRWHAASRPDRLKESALVEHLCRIWRLPGKDFRSLQANARDRGFPSLRHAVKACRPFYARQQIIGASDQTSPAQVSVDIS